MAQDKYFRDELAFLKEQGQQFSEIYPQLSRFLGGRNTDPDVERLLEGFAFLTGKLREKVDDEFPELTHSIINMLWPNYLRPIPSMSILRFKPNGGLSSHQVIEKNTKVLSEQVQGTHCQFKTCRDVDMYPIICSNAFAVNSKDSSQVSLALKLIKEDEYISATGLSSLRFYLGTETYSANNLYLWLGHYLEAIELEFDEGTVSLPLDTFKLVGFDANEGLLPYPKNVYQGYRIFQEYLAFPEAFHFIELQKLSQYIPAKAKRDFKIHFRFNRTLPGGTRVNSDSFVLYATPIINLFQHDADPIDLTAKATRYRVTPSSRNASHYEIFSVDKVQGWQDTSDGRARGQQRIYTPFESFSHDIELARDRLALYYRVRVQEGFGRGGFEHFISFVRSDEEVSYQVDEAVTLELSCTNRQLPVELAIGDIRCHTNESPSICDFENITKPTQSLRPVLDGSLLWTLISNLSLNYMSLLDKDALSSVLKAYDFKALVDIQAARSSKQRLEGILNIQSQPHDKLIKGTMVRGLKSTVTLDPNAFASEGELYLFGTVLSRFFALYASINSFHELVVENAQSKELYTWGTQAGMQPLI